MTLTGNIVTFGSVDEIMLGTVHFIWDGGLLGFGGGGGGEGVGKQKIKDF